MLLRVINAQLRHLRKRLRTALHVLRTAYPYRHLIRHDRLNYRFKQSQFAAPELKVIAEDQSWRVLEIGGFHFYWPADYAVRGLRGIYKEVFTPAAYNPHAYEIPGVEIKTDDWVVDAGACEGYFTYYALKRGANVLLVEPVPLLAEALSLTFAREIKAGKVIVLTGGLGEHEGEVELAIPRDALFAASIESVVDMKPETVDRVKIFVYTLDGVLKRNLVPRIDFLKMDIEGAEVAAFKGASELLRTQKPRLAIAVYHQFENARIIRGLVLHEVPSYRIKYRGIYVKEGIDFPRPFMLHATIS